MYIIAAISTLIIAVTGLPEGSGKLERSWHVNNESRLAISGHSNVNDFRCEVDNYYSADNLHLNSTPEEQFLFSDNEIVINLMEFDCGKNLITRDFRESLKADRNPEMVINFLSLEKVPDNDPLNGGEDIAGNLKVTIAGVTKEVNIHFSATGNGNGTTYLNGSHEFQFSDFDLVPPTKMWGLISVENELEVTFNLVLEEFY